jgi:hypothetical protein
MDNKHDQIQRYKLILNNVLLNVLMVNVLFDFVALYELIQDHHK